MPGILHHQAKSWGSRSLEERLRPARLLRLEPDELRAPTELITEGRAVDFLNERGRGLPAIFDVLVNRDVESFVAILQRIRGLFPSVQKLGLSNPGGATKAMEVWLAGGRRVTAEFMSEGLLYYLAFAALPYLSPTSAILIEEPENGLHPARIAEVMRVLREVSKTTQVLIATHSPLVINEMQPEEVTVVTRPSIEEGTRVTLIKDTPNFEQRSKVYALGELWLSYADGNLEAPLFREPEPLEDEGEEVEWKDLEGDETP
jgi:predicted ATPase